MMALKKSHPLVGRADIMANIGQSTPSTRDSDLPDPCGEKRELRRIVQELEAENERLRKALERIDQIVDETEEIMPAEVARIFIQISHTAQSTLDGGGGGDE